MSVMRGTGNFTFRGMNGNPSPSEYTIISSGSESSALAFQ